MPIDLRTYTPEWQAFRKERLRQAGHRCESCGVADRSVRESAQGDLYMVYLSIAHCPPSETWKAEAETMVLCQRCHRRYDRQFRRKGSSRDMSPIGYASLYIDYRGGKVLAGMSRTVEQLRDMLLTVPVHTMVEIQMVALQTVVGNGDYRVDKDGTVEVVAEHGACVGLGALL